MALNQPWKGHLFIAWEMKQEGKAVALFVFSWECVHQATQILFPPLRAHRWPGKWWLSTDFRVINKLSPVGEFTNTIRSTACKIGLLYSLWLHVKKDVNKLKYNQRRMKIVKMMKVLQSMPNTENLRNWDYLTWRKNLIEKKEVGTWICL